jgi:hypothetical protein
MRYVRHIAITLVALAALIMPLTAVGAVKAPALSELRMATAQSGSDKTVIVSGTLSNDLALPGTVVLPIPKDATPAWVGQVVGTDPSQDPTANYRITPGKEYDLISIDVDKARTAQVELVTSAGGDASMSLRLPIIGTVKQATLEFWVPKGSAVTTVSNGVALQNSGSSDYDIYSVTKESPKKGSTLKGSVTVSASTGSSTGSGNAGSGSSAPVAGGGGTVSWQGILGVILVTGVAAAVGFFGVNSLMALRERRTIQEAAAAAPPAAGASERAAATRSKQASGSTSSAEKKAAAPAPRPRKRKSGS